MAARFLVGAGNRTWDGSNTAIWAASSGGASGVSVPTSSDDVTIDTNSGNGILTIAAGAVCNNFTVAWTAVKTNELSLSADFAPAGTVSLVGNSDVNRVCVHSNAKGTPRTVTIATLSALSDFDFEDIAFAGAATISGTRVGNCGGNSGSNFTPTTPATQTANGTTSFSWSSAARWTSRVPLPQDDVVVSNAFSGGQTITIDMPRVGKSIDFSGSTGNPALSHAAIFQFGGSWKLAIGMTRAGSATTTAAGRSSFVIQSNGVASAATLNLNGPGGTYTLSDALTINGNNLLHTMGTLNDAGFSVTANAFQGSSAATLNKTGTWTFTGSGTVWNTNFAAMTVNDTGGTIKFTEATAATKIFAGGGKAFNGVWFSGAGTGIYQLTGANTFGTFQTDASRSVQFTAGTTTTAATWSWGNGCTIGSITAASHTLAKSGGGQVIAQTVSVSRSTSTPGTTFYALNGSTNGGNNSGWTFGAGNLVADAGAYAVSGKAATLLAQRKLTAAAGAYALAVNAAVLAANHLIAVAGMPPRRFTAPSRNSLTAPSRNSLTAPPRNSFTAR